MRIYTYIIYWYIFRTFLGDFGLVKHKHSMYPLVLPGDFFKVEIMEAVEIFRTDFSCVVIFDVIYYHHSVLSNFSVDMLFAAIYSNSKSTGYFLPEKWIVLINWLRFFFSVFKTNFKNWRLIWFLNKLMKKETKKIYYFFWNFL